MTYAELRQMYFEEFAPLYDYLSAQLGHLPGELHFEVSAAFDHLMRAGDDVGANGYEANIAKAVGHLKRASFDAFKLIYRYTIRALWLKLRRPMYEEVDNGAFVMRVNDLWDEAKKINRKARSFERFGKKDDTEEWIAAFEEWKKLRPIADELETMERSDGARRARSRHVRRWIVSSLVWLGLTVLGFVVAKELEVLWVRIFG